MCYNGRIIAEYKFLRIKGVLMDMNKDLEDFSIVYDNGMNNNNFVDSLCHPELVSRSLNHEILNQVQNDNTLGNNSLCHPEFSSGSQEEDILKRVPNDRELVGAHKAFTLSESLIMMAIVGVIAVITLVSLSGLKPNKDKLLLQKAHRATLEAVAEIANDTVAYPPLQSADASFRGHLLFAARRQVEMALFTPDLTQAITGDGVDCTIYGTPGGDTVPKQLMCSKLDANGNPVTRLNSDGLTEFVYTTDCKKNPPRLTLDPLDPIDTSTFTVNTGNNTIETLKPTGGGHSDSVLPNIGSAGETTTSSNVKITPASAVLTDRSVPTRDSGKYTSENKFAYLFAHIMQPSGKDISCNNKVCTFNTSDGMSWTVTDNFSAGNVNSTATIKVDINGDKKPNKAYNPDKPTEVKTPDQFTFTVRANGQVTVPANDAVAQKYLQSRK